MNRTLPCSAAAIGIWAALAAGPALADEAATPDVPTPKPVFSVTYQCESGATVVARYDNSDPDQPRATIDYKGQSFDMFNVRSGSGARYSTEQGLSPDKGLQWWTKGDGATLSEMLMDHTAPAPTAIETCTAKQV